MSAQNKDPFDRANSLKQNIVKIICNGREKEVGFGIIVGETPEHLIVVTSNHLVDGGKNYSGPVTIEGILYISEDPQINKVVSGNRGNFSIKEDVAVVLLDRPNSSFSWNRKSLDRDMLNENFKKVGGRKVRFVTNNTDNGWAISSKDGEIDRNHEDNPKGLKELSIADDQAANGVSGTAYISKSGIVAMLDESSDTNSRTIPISRIKCLVESFGYSFQATTTNFKLPKPMGFGYGIGVELGLGIASGSDLLNSNQKVNLFAPVQVKTSFGPRFKKTSYSLNIAHRLNDHTGALKDWNQLDPKLLYGLSIVPGKKYRVELFYGSRETRGNTVLTQADLYNLKLGRSFGSSSKLEHLVFLGLTYIHNRQSYLIDANVYVPARNDFVQISSNDKFKLERLVLGVSYSIRFGKN